MLPDKETGCHRTGFTKTCREGVIDHKCRLWKQLMGHNPNTGEPMNQWDCADSWDTMLKIENSQMQRQTAAAVESFRNEVVSINQHAALAPPPEMKLING